MSLWSATKATEEIMKKTPRHGIYLTVTLFQQQNPAQQEAVQSTVNNRFISALNARQDQCAKNRETEQEKKEEGRKNRRERRKRRQNGKSMWKMYIPKYLFKKQLINRSVKLVHPVMT